MADQMAEAQQKKINSRPTGMIQRKCSCGGPIVSNGECSACNKKKGLIQRKATNQRESEVVPPIVHEVLRQPGRPLDAETRAFMEPRFGQDFSHVRVHTDGKARASAQSINAHAYTSGQNLVFNSGRYQPATEQGKSLIAHELAHSIQQKGLYSTPTVFDNDQNSNRFESSARKAAHAIESGGEIPALGQLPSSIIMRQEGDERYSLNLLYPPNDAQRHNDLTLAQAQRQLHRFSNRIEAHLVGGYEGHQSLKRTRDDQFIVGAFSDLLAGGISIPPLSIWSSPRRQLRQGRADAERGEIASAGRTLQRAAYAIRRAERRVYNYREGTISGADRAITGLEGVQVASTVIVTVGTGGTAGLVAGAALGGTQQLAGEATRVHLGLQDSIDWTGIAFDTLFSLVVGRFGGRLGRTVAGKLGSGVSVSVVRDLIVGRASGMAHTVARELYDAARGEIELSVDGFIDRLAEQLTLKAVFLDLVGSAAGGAATRVAARQRTNASRRSGRRGRRNQGRRQPRRGQNQPELHLVRPTQESSPSARPVSPSTRPSGIIDINQARSRRADPLQTGSRETGPVTNGNTALAIAPEPIQTPRQQPLRLVEPAPAIQDRPSARASSVGSQPSNQPGAVAIAAVNQQTSNANGNQPMQIRLVLPPEKSAHAPLYAALIRGRRLQHIPSKPRRTAQRTKWDSELRPPKGQMSMNEVVWRRFDDLGIRDIRRLRPNWTQYEDQVKMEVDHRVEWQVLGTADEFWGDSMSNYELLDRDSNGASGRKLRRNIRRERVRLANLYGQQMMTQRIVFTELVMQGGSANPKRWLPEEIQQGDHYHALMRLRASRER